MARSGLWRIAALFPLAAWAFHPLPSHTLESAAAASPPAGEAAAAPPRGAPSGLDLVFFSVRQGDATLIRTPDGRNILIDGGVCRTGWNRFDAAEKVIIPYLREEGISRLDLVVGTHPDFDHIGGLLTIVSDERIEIGCYLDPGKEHDTEVYQRLLRKVKDRNIPYRLGRAGMKLDFGPGVDAEILSPPKILGSANDCSIVLRLQFGKVSFLLTGDAEEEAEIRMKSRYGRRLASTVLKAGHHGSRNSSGELFLDMVSPKIVVVSAGARNKFGHPHKEALDRFAGVGATVYRTDEMGTIVMRTDGKRILVSKRMIPSPAAPPSRGGEDGGGVSERGGAGGLNPPAVS